jgi:preprotein translocase subunit SecE
MAENTTTIETVREAAGGRIERARLFLSEVRNELRRVTWPTQKEVYATTVVVIVTSVFIGMYLWLLSLGFDRIVRWIFSRLA